MALPPRHLPRHAVQRLPHPGYRPVMALVAVPLHLDHDVRNRDGAGQQLRVPLRGQLFGQAALQRGDAVGAHDAGRQQGEGWHLHGDLALQAQGVQCELVHRGHAAAAQHGGHMLALQVAGPAQVALHRAVAGPGHAARDSQYRVVQLRRLRRPGQRDPHFMGNCLPMWWNCSAVIRHSTALGRRGQTSISV